MLKLFIFFVFFLLVGCGSYYQSDGVTMISETDNQEDDVPTLYLELDQLIYKKGEPIRICIRDLYPEKDVTLLSFEHKSYVWKSFVSEGCYDLEEMGWSILYSSNSQNHGRSLRSIIPEGNVTFFLDDSVVAVTLK